MSDAVREAVGSFYRSIYPDYGTTPGPTFSLSEMQHFLWKIIKEETT